MAEELMQEEKNETGIVAEAESTEKEAVIIEPESEPEAEKEEALAEPESESEAERESSESGRKPEEESRESSQDADDEEVPRPKNKRFKSIMEYFQFGPDEDFSRDDYILARIRDEDLMEYLRMERERERERRAAKEVREKRFFRTFELLAVLITTAVIVGLLKDNPLVLVNILYIFGILFAVWTWKNPKNPPKE